MTDATKETLIQKIEHVAGVLELDAEHLYVLFHKELDKVLHVHAANPEAAKAFVSAAVTAPAVTEPVTQTATVTTTAQAAPETTA